MDAEEKVRALVEASEQDKERLFNQSLGSLSEDELGRISDNLIKSIEQTIQEVQGKAPRSLIPEAKARGGGHSGFKRKPAVQGKRATKTGDSQARSFIDVASKTFDKMAENDFLEEDKPSGEWGGFREWKKNLSEESFANRKSPSSNNSCHGTAGNASFSGALLRDAREGQGHQAVSLDVNSSSKEPLDVGVKSLTSQLSMFKKSKPGILEEIEKTEPRERVEPPVLSRADTYDPEEASVFEIEDSGREEGPETVKTPLDHSTSLVKAPPPQKRKLTRLTLWATPLLLGLGAGIYGLEAHFDQARAPMLLGAGILGALNFGILLSFMKINVWPQTKLAIAGFLLVSLTYLEPIEVQGMHSILENTNNVVFFLTAFFSLGFFLSCFPWRKNRKSKVI